MARAPLDRLEGSASGRGPLLGSAGERLIDGLLALAGYWQEQDRLIDEQLRAVDELTTIVRAQLATKPAPVQRITGHRQVARRACQRG